MRISLTSAPSGQSLSELREVQSVHASTVTSIIAMVAACIDNKDWEILSAQFEEDVELQFGKMKSSQKLSRNEFIAWASQAYSYGTWQHMVEFLEFHFDLKTGSRARVTSCWQSTYFEPQAAHSKAVTSEFRCVHELHLTSGAWKIARIRTTTPEDEALTSMKAEVSIVAGYAADGSVSALP